MRRFMVVANAWGTSHVSRVIADSFEDADAQVRNQMLILGHKIQSTQVSIDTGDEREDVL